MYGNVVVLPSSGAAAPLNPGYARPYDAAEGARHHGYARDLLIADSTDKALPPIKDLPLPTQAETDLAAFSSFGSGYYASSPGEPLDPEWNSGDNVPDPGQPSPSGFKDGRQPRHRLGAAFGGTCLCGSCCCLALLLVIACVTVGYHFTERHHHWEEPLGIKCPLIEGFCSWNEGTNLAPNNLTRHLAWNGCQGLADPKSDVDFNSCGPPCFDAKLPSAMDTFNSQRPWRYVTFPSKAGTPPQQMIELTGWWLPTDASFGQTTGGRSPVVIVQHGANANFNSRIAQTCAYLLRSIGFNVFMPNLRDMGSSQKSSHRKRISWGWDYYLDLLGALEFVKNDPEGLFGGPRPASQVGIAGLSMGGFIAGTVAGLDHSVPGIWLDSGIFDAKWGALSESLAGYGNYVYLGWLTKWLTPIAWWWANWWAGVDLGFRMPSNSIRCDVPPAVPQRVALIDNIKDFATPIAATQEFLRRFSSFPECYDVTMSWEAQSQCNGGTHCTMIFQFPEAYRRKLCDFFSGVFNRPESVCDLSGQPKFTPVGPSAPKAAAKSSSSGSSSDSSSSGSFDSSSESWTFSTGSSSSSFGSSSGGQSSSGSR